MKICTNIFMIPYLLKLLIGNILNEFDIIQSFI